MLKAKFEYCKTWVRENGEFSIALIVSIAFMAPLITFGVGSAFLIWQSMPLPTLFIFAVALWLVSTIAIRTAKDRVLNNLHDATNYLCGVASVLKKPGDSLRIEAKDYTVTVERKGHNAKLTGAPPYGAKQEN